MFQLFVYVCDFLCVLCWLRLVAYTGLYNSCLLVSSFLFFLVILYSCFLFMQFFIFCCCFIFPFSANCNFKFIWQQKQNEFENSISDLKNWSKLSTVLMKMLKNKNYYFIAKSNSLMLIYNPH